MKFRLLILLVLGILSGNSFAADYQVQWKNEAVDLKINKILAVEMIDLRGIKIEKWDDEAENYEITTLEPAVYEQVAQAVYYHIKEKVNATIEVTEDLAKVSENSNPLILNVRLKGSFKAKPQRLLMRMIYNNADNKGEVENLRIECDVLDGQTKEVIFTMTDIQPLALKLYGDPFKNELDLQSLGLVLDMWGNKIAELIALKK